MNKDKPYYVYYESNDFTGELTYNNDNLMWRYWAAKEMAKEIFYRFQKKGFYFSNQRYISNLAQILKKEWFR